MIRFHFEHEMPMVSVGILWMEDTCILLEASRGFVPLSAVEIVEIVTPVELELVVGLIVGENLNVVVEHIPRHIY